MPRVPVATFPSHRTTIVVAWTLGVPTALGLLGLVPAMLRAPSDAPLWFLPGLLGFAGGAVCVRLQPDNLAGRRLLVFGAVAASFAVLGFWILQVFDDNPDWALLGPATVVNHVQNGALAAALLACLAVYPDGRYHRWYEAIAVRVVAALVVLVPLAMLVVRPTIEPSIFFEWALPTGEAGAAELFPAIGSPLYVGGPAWVEPALRAWFGLALTALPLLGAVIVGLRYRRLRGTGRLQVRWPMYGALAGVLLGVEGALWQVTTLPSALSMLIELSALVVIISTVVIGLVRPDLFDVDRAVLRALLFLPLWLAIAAVYVAVAALLGLAARGQGLEVALVVAIAASVTFEPVRRWLVRRAGRWAHGEAFDGDDLVRRLGATLEHTHDLEALTSAVAATVREGLGVAWVRIRVDGHATVLDATGPVGEPERTAPLEHGGVHLGELACGPRARRLRATPDPVGFETLARQVSLAVHNAQLAGDLARSLDEIRSQAAEVAASRTRIVTAQDDARRRLERDLHDGAQQELVALIARIGLAQQQLRRDQPADVRSTLEALGNEAREALDTLRRLASGIHPPVLTDHGLVAALDSRADRSPVPVRVRPEPGLRGRRFSAPVEAAAYFVACEGIANALKHADPAEISVGLGLSSGHLEVTVSDDGAGFDAAKGHGPHHGIDGVADRLEALGGSVALDSRPGQGTRLIARLPVTEAAGV